MAIELVGDAQPDGLDTGQDIELVQRDRADAVHGDGVPKRNGVEPADPSRAAGDRPEFVAARGDPGTDLVVELGRIRSGADPGRVGLDDADDLVDLERTDPAPGARAAGHRVRRGHERVTAVVEIEQRALRALEEDVFAACEGALHQPRRVVQVRAKALPPADGHCHERFDLERGAAHALEQPVLVRQRALDPLAQHGRVEEVLHAQAQPPGPIAVAGPDPPTSRSDLGVAEPGLVGDVERHVVRHDHVGAATDPDARDVDAPRGEHVQLVDQGDRVDHDAVADDRGDVRVEHARGRQTELEHLVAADHGVAGVVTTLVPDDHGHLLGQEVGHLALALVAPLEPDDHRGGH